MSKRTVAWTRKKFPWSRHASLPDTYWKGEAGKVEYAVFSNLRKSFLAYLYSKDRYVRADGMTSQTGVFFRTPEAAKRACEKHAKITK